MAETKHTTTFARVEVANCARRVLLVSAVIAAGVMIMGWAIDHTDDIVRVWNGFLFFLSLKGTSHWFPIGVSCCAMGFAVFWFCVAGKFPLISDRTNISLAVFTVLTWFVFNRAAFSSFESWSDLSTYAQICMVLISVPWAAVLICIFALPRARK